MALNIRNAAVKRLAAQIAALTEESKTEAVRRALHDRLERLRRDRAGRRLAEELVAIGKRCARLPDLDTRTPEEIRGYDEHGLPA